MNVKNIAYLLIMSSLITLSMSGAGAREKRVSLKYAWPSTSHKALSNTETNKTITSDAISPHLDTPTTGAPTQNPLAETSQPKPYFTAFTQVKANSKVPFEIACAESTWKNSTDTSPNGTSIALAKIETLVLSQPAELPIKAFGIVYNDPRPDIKATFYNELKQSDDVFDIDKTLTCLFKKTLEGKTSTLYDAVTTTKIFFHRNECFLSWKGRSHAIFISHSKETNKYELQTTMFYIDEDIIRRLPVEISPEEEVYVFIAAPSFWNALETAGEKAPFVFVNDLIVEGFRSLTKQSTEERLTGILNAIYTIASKKSPDLILKNCEMMLLVATKAQSPRVDTVKPSGYWCC